MWDKKNLANSYDVFISYRRDKRGVVAAHLVKARLEKSGYRVFLDVEELRQGDFNKALLARIESIKHFVVILTPNSLERCYQKGDWLYREIKCAFKHNKNIVPIMFDDTEAAAPPPSLRETDSVEAQKRNRCVYRKLQKLYNFQACVCRSENLTRDLQRLPNYLPLGCLRNAKRVCCSRWFSGVLAGICILAAIALSVCYQRRREQLLIENLAISVKYEMDAVAYLIQEAETLNGGLCDNEVTVRDYIRMQQEYQNLKNYYEYQKKNKVLVEETNKNGSTRLDETVGEYIAKRNKIYGSWDDYFKKLEKNETQSSISEVMKEINEEYEDLCQWYNEKNERGVLKPRLVTVSRPVVGNLGKIMQLRKEENLKREIIAERGKEKNVDVYSQLPSFSEEIPREVKFYSSN